MINSYTNIRLMPIQIRIMIAIQILVQTQMHRNKIDIDKKDPVFNIETIIIMIIISIIMMNILHIQQIKTKLLLIILKKLKNY